MAKQQQPLRMLFLMAFLVVSAMHAVPADAGRVLGGQISSGGLNKFNPLDPGSTPSTAGPGQPYTGRGCPHAYGCSPGAATPSTAGPGQPYTGPECKRAYGCIPGAAGEKP
ncbi:hypothetical protein ACP4OV_002968 [Aristida adscensionis]